MQFLERLFGKSRAKVEPARLGRSLAEMGGTPLNLLEMLIKDLPQKHLGDAFLAMSSLNLFAWIRVTQNEPLRLGSRAAQKEIYENFASSLAAQYVQLFNPEADPDATLVAITTKAVELIKVWNDSQGKRPSPHWYVGKEVWFMLEETRENADPVQITLLSGVMTDLTITLLEFARGVEVREN